MADIAKSFSGLPLGSLICAPILEVARGQAELCDVYLQYLFKLAFKDGKPSDKPEDTNMITFALTRPVTDGAGNITQQTIKVVAPLLSLVPVPAFTMQEATVQFTMEVKEQTVDKEDTSETATTDFGFSRFGFNAKISGKVTNTSGHTRTSDQSAKYEIFARAIQQPPAEGMAKLSAVFASVIEPIDVGSGG